MDLILYGIRNCDSVVSARRWLEGHGAPFRFHDYRASGLEPERLQSWLREVGIDRLLNRKGAAYRKLDPALRASLSEDRALEVMMRYDWPGNVRELENLMERLSVLVEGDIVELEDMPDSIRGADAGLFPSLLSTLESGLGFNEAVDQFQRGLILEALEHTGWVKAKAAELLKINRTTLVEKIKKMNIEAPDSNESPQ